MEYRQFGKTGLMLSALGFGMNRFPPSRLSRDNSEIDHAAALVERAILEYGINYVDAAHTYSGGYACQIISKLSAKAKRQCHFCVKTSMSTGDTNAEKSYLRIKKSLEAMGLEQADFGFLWAVRSLSEYDAAIAPGGIYDGLRRAKNEGLISHICVSLHTSPEESIKVLQEGLFEGATVSCNPLNIALMEPVLNAAHALGIGIFTMNSLAGGMILQYPQIMPQMPPQFTAAQASFARLLAHPAITSCLSGMHSDVQLKENAATFGLLEREKTISWVQASQIREGFCTGCGYCSGCPKGIPIPALMQGYNAYSIKSFLPKYGVSDQKKLADIYAFETVKKELHILPEQSQNPCIQCGQCERKCTQKLPIIQHIASMYQNMARCGFSLTEWRSRFQALLGGQSGRCVYFYPAGLYTKNLLRLYRELIGNIDFELHVFDRDPALMGTEVAEGYTVEPVCNMEDRAGTICLITNFAHEEEIFQELSKKFSHLNIVKLHKEHDVPWLYLFW